MKRGLDAAQEKQIMLPNYRNTFAGIGAVTATLALTGMGVSARAAIRLDAGTVIPVTLDRQLTSNGNQKGDKFTATVKGDDGSYQGLPAGSVIEGVIMEAKPKQGNDPGVLDLAFRRIRLPNGRSYAITGSTIGLDNKSVTKDSNGKIVAKSSSKNNRLTYVGYGAGAGLLASVLSGGKLHLENIGIGAGLGYLLGSLEKNKPHPNDVNLKEGTKVGVRLDKSLRVAEDGSYLDDTRVADNGGADGNRRVNADDNRNDNAAVRGDNNGVRNEDGGYRNTENGGNPLDRRRNGFNADTAPDAAPNNAANSDNTGIGVLINDTNVKFPANTQPVMVNGVTMVPVRPILDAANVRYTFSNNNGTISAASPNGAVRLSVGSQIAVGEGGERTRLDAAAKRMNGTLYVPVRFLDLATGGKTSYDSDSRTVLISVK